MPKKPRAGSATNTYHFVTQGINKKNIFHVRQDQQVYLRICNEIATAYGITIYHYCLMSNHVHLVLHANPLKAMAQFAQSTHLKYAYFHMKKYHWSGQLFRRSYYSSPIQDDAYLLECGRYVERNPVTAKMSIRPEDYLFSSYRYYAYGERNFLVQPSPAYLGLAQNVGERQKIYRFYVNQERPLLPFMAVGT